MKRPLLALLVALAACSSSPPPRARPTASAARADAGVTAPEPLATGRLPNLATPTRYDLALTLDPREPTYTGRVRIDVEVPAATRAVVLHARGLTLASATAFSGRNALTLTATTRRAAGGREADEELVLTAEEPLAAGHARLDLRFAGSFTPELRGAFRTRVGDDWYAFSDFEPTDARRAFPCFDEPGFKVPFDVTITTPDTMVALANMPELAHTDDADAHTRTTRFATSQPMPTYLVSFAAGPFEFYEGPREPVPVRVATVRGRSALGRLGAETAAAHLAVLGAYFDRPYPYPKLDLVAVPDFGPGAMENPGLITFRDTSLLVDPAHASSRAKAGVYSIIAHELAHQWFGNLVTMAWWNDLWLNEGFATWAAMRVIRTWRPDLGAEFEAVNRAAWAREADSLEGAHPIRSPVTSTSDAIASFDATTYEKGAAVLGMLEAWMGETAFRDGVRAYLNAHAWGNATADHLLDALTTAAGRDVRPIAQSFLDRAGVPRIDVAVQCAPGAVARLTLAQQRYRATAGDAAAEAPWHLPVCVRYPLANGPHVQCVALDEASQSYALEAPAGVCPAWVAPDVDARGYYWSRVTPENLRALLAAPDALSAVEKLDLLSNLDAQLQPGLVDAPTWLDALARLSADRNDRVAERAVSHLFGVERALVTDEARPAFRAWVQRLLAPRMRAVGITPAAHDDEARRELRRTLLSALGMLTDDAPVRAACEAAAERWMREPRSVEGDTAAVALPVASRRANAARFEALQAMLARAENTPQDRALILHALVSFDDPALVRRAYDLALTDTIRVQDLRVLFGRANASPAARALLLTWAREHADALTARLGRNTRALVGALGGLCDDDAIREAERFLDERVGTIEGAARQLRLTAAAARTCAAVRARESSRATPVFSARR